MCRGDRSCDATPQNSAAHPEDDRSRTVYKLYMYVNPSELRTHMNPRGREGGREGRRERGREGGREGRKEGGRDGGREQYLQVLQLQVLLFPPLFIVLDDGGSLI